MPKFATFLKPLDDRVVILPEEAEGVTPGGIVLPDQAQRPGMRGRVVAVGPGCPNERSASYRQMTVKEGDVVIYPQYAGVDYEHDGEKYKILREGEVLGVMER